MKLKQNEEINRPYKMASENFVRISMLLFAVIPGGEQSFIPISSSK